MFPLARHTLGSVQSWENPGVHPLAGTLRATYVYMPVPRTLVKTCPDSHAGFPLKCAESGESEPSHNRVTQPHDDIQHRLYARKEQGTDDGNHQAGEPARHPGLGIHLMHDEGHSRHNNTHNRDDDTDAGRAVAAQAGIEEIGHGLAEIAPSAGPHAQRR
mgnify:CR=1 FL=1